MIGRFFMVLVLLAVSLYIVKYIRKKIDETLKDQQKKSKNKDLDNKKQDPKKLMVKCQLCGLHIPEKEAIKQGDNTFCSLEHAKEVL